MTINVPEELHDRFDYAPIFKNTIDPDLLAEETRARIGKVQNVKLYPYLGRQANKMYHIEHLKTWCDLGVVVEDVHYICESLQSPWLKKFVLRRSRKRAESTDEVEKNIIKLSMNAPYGKFCQCPEKQKNLSPFTDSGKCVKAAGRIGAKSYVVTMNEDGF